MSIAHEIRTYRRHGSVRAASAELGVPFATLYRRLQAAGIDTAGRHRPTAKLTRKRIAELCDLYEAGLTQRDIAQILGITQRAARMLLVREGVPARAPHRPTRGRDERRRQALASIGRLDLLEAEL